MKRVAAIFATLAIVISAISTVAIPATSHADPLGQMTKYSTSPNYTSPGSIITGPDGNLWFASNTSPRKIVVMSTSGTIITSYNTPSGYSKIDNLTNGPDGNVWFSAQVVNSLESVIGKLSPAGGFTIYQKPMPADHNNSAYAHNALSMVFVEGSLWMTQFNSRYLLKFNLNTETFQAISLSTPGANNETQRRQFEASGGMAMNPETGCLAVANVHDVLPKEAYIEMICNNNQRHLIGLDPDTTGSAFIADDIIYDNYGVLWSAGGWLDKISYLDTNENYHYIQLVNNKIFVQEGVLGPDGNMWFTAYHQTMSKNSDMVISVDPGTKAVTYHAFPTNQAGNSNSITVGADGNLWFSETNQNKVTKVGAGTVSGMDNDNDGLSYVQELQQGTSDLRKDTDNDGLSDYTESQWNTNRDTIFCHPTTNYCEYPDPLRQDVYIETDWMYRPNEGPITGYSMQPSAYSIDLIKTAFSNKGIKAHIDTGQLGGGNEVPYDAAIQFTSHQTGVIDFWDYRDGGDGISQNFATNRKDIYRYMVLGHHLSDPGLSDRSGVSLSGADDAFISYGLIKEASPSPVNYSLLDTAIAGTMHHELGHSLCLSNTNDYNGQKTNCIFNGVDAQGTSDYPSSMNYLYQGVLVDYSDGTNSSNDHDDWGAISPKDFTFNESLGSPLPGATIGQLKQAEKIRKERGIKVERKHGKFEVTQTQNGHTKKLNQ